MIEQPLPRSGDGVLSGQSMFTNLAADESCLHLGEFEDAADKYNIINVKLDKCGGLTEALTIAKKAQARGLGLMVGNMLGTSLSMAPAFVIAQLCDFVDIDGPLHLTEDCEHGLTYSNGVVGLPTPALWG